MADESEREILECPICCDLFNNVCETFCGHAFCEYCLNKCLEKDVTICPVCRKDPSPIHPSYTLRRVVEEFRKMRGLHRQQLRPVDPAVEKQKGNTAYEQGHYADAIRHYSTAIDEAASAVLYANRAAAYYKLAQYLLAADDCEKALHMDPAYVKAYLRKAMCLEQMREPEEALRVLDQARVVDKTGSFRPSIDEGVQRVRQQIAPTRPPGHGGAQRPAPPPPPQPPPPQPQQQPWPPQPGPPPQYYQPPPSPFGYSPFPGGGAPPPGYNPYAPPPPHYQAPPFHPQAPPPPPARGAPGASASASASSSNRRSNGSNYPGAAAHAAASSNGPGSHGGERHRRGDGACSQQ